MKTIDILIAFFWALYMVLEAYRESYYWYFRWRSSNWYPDLHPVFFIQRSIAFLPIVFLGSVNCIICCALISPFFHNSFYYLFRNNIDGVYPKGLLDQSVSSTSIMTRIYTPVVRICLLIFGIVILFY